jgi:ABC-type branched-subunit amino acid transport system substrate-binding protein
MRHFLGGILLLTIFSLPAQVLGAASASGSEQSAIVPGEPDLQYGLELYRSGRLDEALIELRGFMVRHPESPELSRAGLALARIFLHQGRPDEAQLVLARISVADSSSEIKLVRGLALVAAGEAEAGRAVLLPLEGQGLATADRAARLRALATAESQLGRPLPALAFLYRGMVLTPEAGEALLAQGHELLQGISDSALAEAAFMFRGTPLGLDSTLQQALRAEARGDREAARTLGEVVVRSSIAFPYRQGAIELYGRLTGHQWLQRSVGVLLPLSGKYAAFGELVRRGMELALAEQAPAGQPVQFLYRDTGADSSAGADLVSKLVAEDGVMAIVGPITGGAAQSAAVRAQQERVPLLTLSPREGLPEIGDEIFRNSLTPGLQIEALARYAVEERGLVSFGILHPDNRLGREMTDLFTAAVNRRGGSIFAVASYPENATDFGRQIRILLKSPPEPSGLGETMPGGGPSPKLPGGTFDALFIPDYADQIGLIAPQLPYYGLEGMSLLGINGWNSPELLRVAGSSIEGAVFVDGFFVHSPYPFVRSFVDRYFEQFGEEPTILEAQGYDVAGILLGILQNPRVVTREDVRQALSRLRNYPGVTGATSFNLQGEAEKILFLLQVQNGNIVQINAP